jgi:hypothetical protein
MSDFGMFEADEAAQSNPRLAAKTASRKLEAAIDEVRAKFESYESYPSDWSLWIAVTTPAVNELTQAALDGIGLENDQRSFHCGS